MKNNVRSMLALYFGGAFLIAAGAWLQFGSGYGLIVFGVAIIAEVVIP